MLEALDAVNAQLDHLTEKRELEVSVLEADLDSEKEARRGWQDKAAVLREKLSDMVQYLYVGDSDKAADV